MLFLTLKEMFPAILLKDLYYVDFPLKSEKKIQLSYNNRHLKHPVSRAWLLILVTGNDLEYQGVLEYKALTD